MVRNRKRKSETHGQTPANVMKRAVIMVQDGISVRDVAKRLGVSKSTVQRYVQLTRDKNLDTVRLKPHYNNNLVFSEDEENDLQKYLITASKHRYGLTSIETRELAFQYAKKNNKTVPRAWETNARAGRDWFYGFMQRHPLVSSIQKPKIKWLSQASEFKKKNIGDFFDNLESLMQCYKFPVESIYNCEKIGLTTVHKASNLVALKEAKQVDKLTPAERSTLVTMNVAANASGNVIPPFLVFPRMHFEKCMIKNAPPGTNATAHSSGWLTSKNFEIWLDHFIRHSKSSMKNPVLLLMDNRDIHNSINILDKIKANGVVLLTFPPHCNHKLQPLGRSVYGPFKHYYNKACKSWQRNNPGKAMTIYDVAENLGYAFPKAFTCENIIAGFRVAGIMPFNILHDDKFLHAFITNRMPEQPESGDLTTQDIDQRPIEESPTSQQNSQTPDVIDDTQFFEGFNAGTLSGQTSSSIEIQQYDDETTRAHPGAPDPGTSDVRHVHKCVAFPYGESDDLRKVDLSTCGQERKNLTETPLKENVEDQLKGRKKKRKRVKTETKLKKRKKSNKNKVSSNTDSHYVNDEWTKFGTNTSDLDESFESVIHYKAKENTPKITKSYLNKGDYILVEYITNNTVSHFVGLIVDEPAHQDMVKVKPLNRLMTKAKGAMYVLSEKDDIVQVDRENILLKLPKPTAAREIEHTPKQFFFNVNLDQFY